MRQRTGTLSQIRMDDERSRSTKDALMRKDLRK